MTDSQLSELGLRAIGDIVQIRQFALEADVLDFVPIDRKQRKKQLLSAVRPSQRSARSVASVMKKGRPTKNYRSISLGMRTRDEDRNIKARSFLGIKAPLGDANFVKVDVLLDSDYATILSQCEDVLFPDGENPVIGQLANFTTELVNGHCVNVNELVHGPFSIESYLVERHVGGAIRLYLLCNPIQNASSSSSHELQ